MKKIIIIVSTLVLVLIVALALDLKFFNQPEQIAYDYRNISIDGQATQYFGNEVKGDFNSDGLEDVAFLLTQDGGGSGTFFYVATALREADGFQGINAIFLGDRIAPQTTQFKNGEIIVNYADRKPNEPMTAIPSVGISRYFKVVDNRLVEIQK